MHGRRLHVLPCAAEERPAPELIEWRNEHVYAP
jgi:hypothetical protein